MTDERLIGIETRITHQEHTIAELDDALGNQQAQIANLELQVRMLIDRVKALMEATPGGADDDARPPHY